MMFTQQTEATTCPTIEPTISRGVQLHEESACKPGRGAPSGNKNAETHGYYRRKIKLEAVSFDDLNFSSSGGEQLRKRFLELLNHCGGEQFVSAIRRRIIERVCLHLSYACAPFEQIQLLTDMVSSQMRESLALNNGCTLAAYPCRSAAVRGIRARVVSFNNIHRSDHVFRRSRHVLGECRNRRLGRIKTDLVVQLPQHAHESIAFADDRDQCALASVDDPRPQLDKVQIEAIELVFGEDNALDDATPDSRDKVFATTMVQQFDKTFRQLFAAARTEVQIFETDGF